jgi:methyl-accepting chemotaxis protein
MTDLRVAPAGGVLLRPILAVTDRLRTSARLAALVVVLLVPGIVAAVSYTRVIGGQIDFAVSERAGAELLRPALEALADTAAGRDPDLAALRDAASAHPELGVTDVSDGSPGALVDLITEVGNTSKLILDPDLDSFYVMDAQVVQLPKALLAAATQGSTVSERAVQAGQLASAAAAIRSDVRTAAANTAFADLAGRLDALVAAADAIEALSHDLTSALTSSTRLDAAAVADAVKAATVPAGEVLHDLLAARVDGLSGSRAVTLTVTACGFLVAVWLAAAVWWRTRHDVGLTVTGVTAIAEGDLAVRSLPTGRDELGDVGRALAVARARLAEQDSALRGAHSVREDQLKASFLHQRQAERQLRERAQSMIDESTVVISEELRDVVAQVDRVRGATGTIDERVSVATTAVGAVIERAHRAEDVVAALGESLQRVAGTAQLIAGIAGQTRLLALNATIEAARAGEAGRGFTVVANEVKDLAGTTAQSTEQIATTIASLERDAAEMTSTIEAIVAGVGGIDEANTMLRTVAADQRGDVDRLDQRVSETIERIEQMSGLSQRLERRHHERIAATGPVLLRLKGGPTPHNGQLIDLSSGGIRCAADPSMILEVGDAVDVELSLDNTPVRVHARVMHVAPFADRVELGLQFLAPDPATVARIDAYVTGG